MKNVLLSVFCFLIISASANVGDTTIITSHVNTNLNSPPSNDDLWVTFPNSKTWSKIIMKFTLGCGTPNCSGWDYTVSTSLGKKTGLLDSTIASIDTVAHDTVWTKFDQVKYNEVGRLITPYGTYMAQQSNGFNKLWTHPYYFDLTDYAGTMKDSVSIRIHYDGWTDAFSGKVEFIMVEGTPSRAVLQVNELYNEYITYNDGPSFEAVAIPKSVQIPSGCTSAKLNLIMTGHGSTGEFMPYNYHIKVNGTEVVSRLLWKGDCGINAVSPQGGTWIFNRANWCPGEKINVYELDLSSYITAGQTASIDLDMDDFVLASGESAGYGIASYLICYGSQKNNDVAMEEIIAPSSDKPYLHFNPICGNPIVSIKNFGKNNLTDCDITYWIKGGNKCYYQWHGQLKPFQTARVVLPSFDWSGLDTSDRQFFAEVSWPNGVTDEFSANNLLYAKFNLPPLVDSVFVINLKTNNHPEENKYLIRNENGDTILFKTSLPVSKTVLDTVTLQPGCYSFDFYDYDAQWEGGDGLSWWLNTQQGLESSGTLAFRRFNNTVIKIFNPDFGSNIHYEFTVGNLLGSFDPKAPCTEPIHTGILSTNEIQFSVYPNPATNTFFIKTGTTMANAKVTVFDVFGKQMITKQVYLLNSIPLEVNAEVLSNGIYFVNVEYNGIKSVKQISIVK